MADRLHLFVLASGSKGNAAVVEGPEGSLLVDCGLSRRELHRRADAIGCDLGRVRAILVTHEHGDHTKGLPVVCKHFDGPVYATPGTAASKRLDAVPLSHSGTLDIAGMHVQAFPLSHDVADPMCFRFDLMERDRRIDSVGWATDTGTLTKAALKALRDCRILGIEANHDPDLLETGPYPRYLKVRVGGRHGHLSNAQAAAALPQLVTTRTEAVVAMHISQQNNDPSCVRQALAEAVGDARTLYLASQDEPLVVW